MVKPPQSSVPVPSLGRPVDIAVIFACTAIRDLTEQLTTVTVKDVADSLELQHSTVSRLLGEVEAEGLIERHTDTADRRRTVVTLTGAGRGVVADAIDVTRYMLRAVLDGWHANEVTDLTRLLRRLADSVSAAKPWLAAHAAQHFCTDVTGGPGGSCAPGAAAHRAPQSGSASAST